MKNIWIYFFVTTISLLSINNAFAQGATCATAEPFCTGSGATFPAGTNQPAAPAGNNYGCLGTQPNPAWYYLQIDNPGNITIDLSNSNIVDIDFILYGPFADLAAATSQCGGLGNGGASGNIVDCSYSASAFEQADITGALNGEVYILLITNFSNQPTNINATQVAGNASTNCSILLPCAPVEYNDISINSPYDCNDPIVSLTANPTSASPGNLSITPGFLFDITTDAFSATQNTLTLYAGPNATGPVVAYWGPTNTGGNYQGPLPNNSQFTATLEYLDPSISYSMEWCDSGNSGTFNNEIRMSGSNTVISNAPLNGASGCTTINLGTPEGTGTFSSTGIGLVNNTDGTGTWDPSLAGPGVHTITYNWDSGDGCAGSMDQTVIVCCDSGYSIIDPMPDTVCLGDSTYFNVNLPGTTSTQTVFSNTTTYTIPNGGYASSPINVTGVNPLLLSAGTIDSVCVNVNYNPISSLDLYLVSPNGDSIQLTTGNGGISTTSLTNVCFTPSATDAVTNYAGPFSIIPSDTSLLPEQAFSGLAGGGTNGGWYLGVTQTSGLGSGSIIDWSIHFAPATASSTFSWSGPNMSCTNCANPSAAPTVTSDYSVTVVDGLGCSYTDTVTVYVETALDTPQVSCGTTTSTDITFDWLAVASATGYEVSLDSGTTWISPTGALSHTVSGLSPNTPIHLYVRATGGTGFCPNPWDSLTCVTLNCPLIPSLDAQTDVSCNGGADGSATISVSNAIGVLTYQEVAPNTGTPQANGTFTGLSAGTYTFEVSDATLACSITQSVTITEPSALSITMAATDASCNGGSDGTGTATPTGGTAPYTYAWDDPAIQTTANATGLSAGIYNVIVTDDNGCTITDAITVTEPSAITLTTSTTDALCFGGSDGTASVVAAGGTVALDYTYAWDDTNTQSTATATGLAAGTYNVTVTDDNGCTMTTSATVGQPAAGISLTMTSTDALCYNQASGTATATPAGGTAPYTYSWEDNQTTQTAVNLVADTYSVTMTDDNGCIGIDSVVVGNAPIITQSATTTDALCNGASDGTATHLPLGGAGGFTYLWDNGQTTQTATGLAAGTHCVTATDINGCTTDTCVTVAEPTALSNNAFVTAPISCDYTSDGTATINMTGGTSPYNYAWSNGQTTQTATGLDTMMYYVTVTDANSCTFIDSTQLTAPSALVLTLDADSVGCRFGSDGSILSTVVGGTPAYSYAWSNGPTVANNTNLSVGFYDLTVTDANGCTATETVEVGQPASAVIANILSTSDASCFGSSDGSIDADALGGTPNYTFAWSNGQLTEDLSGLAAGTYTVTATDANGCTASTTTTIGQPSQIIANIQQYSNYNGAAISCPGAADGALQVTASGGQSPYTFAWSGANPQNTQIASNLAEGTYVVTVTDASGCSVLDSFTISDPVPLQATETHVDVFCNGDCDGQILVNAVSGTGTLGINGYEYNITGPGQTGNVFSATNSFFGLCAGTYTVTVRDGNNCTLPVSITIAEPAALAATTATTDVSCNGGIDGSATVTATGGVAPYTYNWSNGQTTQTAVNLAAGGYDVTITDDNGCDLVTSVVLTEPTAMAGTTTFDEPSCNGGTDGSATVSVTGGTAPYTYLWNTGSTNATAIGLGAGSYTVTSTDANGCQLINTVTVSQPQAIAVTISGSGLTCSGNGSGSATANPTGGTAPYTYLWSDGQTTATATGLNASTYTVLVVDANGCSINAQTTLSQPTPVVATQVSSTDISCNGGADGSATVMGSGGSAPYTYNWDNGQTGATATGLAAGTYTATITDANGCDATISVNIFEPAILEIPQITTTNVNCKGGSDGTASAFVNGGTFPYSFSWSNGETTQVINNLAAGTYFVTVTDGNGCTANSSVIITEPAAFLVGVINVNDALCDGTASGQLAAVISGGTLPASGDYTYVWSNGASTPVVSAVTAGTYSLTVIDANGCTLDLSATVGNGGSINANIVASADASCFGGNDGSATVTATGGTGGLTYQWSDPAGQTNPTATNLAAGTYYVTVNDANGCAVVDSVTVGEADAFTINTNVTDVACFGENSGQLSITGASVTPGQILWSNGQVGNAASNLSAGAYSVTVTSIDGCTQTFNYNITQPTALELSIDQTSPILCNDDSTGALAATVNGGTANYSYSWTDGVNGPNRSNLPAGTYTLQVTDANGCTVAEVSQLGNPTAIGFSFVDAMGVACVGDNNGFIQVQGTGGSTALGNYEYSLDGQNWQSGNLFPNLTDGQYDIYVRDQNGCIAEDSVEVAAADSFFITAFNTTLDSTGVVEYGDSINLGITLNEPTGAVVSWIELNNGTTLDSALAILVNPTEASIYRFTAVSPAGCVVDTSLTVQVDKPRRASAPTAFTPNSDGTNDAFFIQAEAERVSQVQSFRVYDRWGELVFESINSQPNDPQAGWDGTFKGKPMQGGVFAWYAEVEFIDGHVEVLRGEVTLLR
jgi:gliding motility-associated-like protein